MATLSKSTFDFLLDLKENNNRPWFEEHKHRYKAAHEDVIAFADELLEEMRKHDNLETVSGKKSLFRIYRDVRFSKDKSPYKTHFSGYFTRATKLLRGGYYFHFEPGRCMVGGGFWNPNKEDLKRIRDEFAQDASEIRQIIADPVFVKTFGELKGDGVKTAPKGFDKTHPDIDLIRMKQFIVSANFTDKEVFSGNYASKIVDTFNAMRPFFDYMSEVLTTDANGVPLYEA